MRLMVPRPDQLPALTSSFLSRTIVCRIVGAGAGGFAVRASRLPAMEEQDDNLQE